MSSYRSCSARLTRAALLSLAMAVPALPHTPLAAEDDRAGVEFFEAKIRPVLVTHCYECHAAEAKSVKGNLRLDTRAGLLAGGDSGPAVVPGKVNAGVLIGALRHEDYEMPPKGKLPEGVIADFVKWIEMGAPDPREEESAAATPQYEQAGLDWWSLQPPRRVEPPAVRGGDWPRDPIDRFVLARLEREKLAPAADAERRVLARRLYFDLLGLPPAPEEMEAFLADDSPAAVERLVDRLLASPRFGERWGRHWLDVARYAESNGNTRNALYPHAWRYRDWVIDAFNRDLPYDRFILEQLAGDLLPAESPSERNRQRTATGFLAIMSKPNAGNNKGFLMDLVADQIETASKGFLGLTVACARCHDHKFDPIPTADYYALAGIFASSEVLYGGGGNNMGGAPATPLVELEPTETEFPRELNKQQRARAESLLARHAELRTRLSAAAGNKKNNNKKNANNPAAALREEQAAVEEELQQLGVAPPAQAGLAMGVRDRPKPADARIHIKGEAGKLGEVVPRGFLSALPLENPPTIPAGGSGRLEFAQWIVRHDHPLTDRVAVNRVWQHLFGEGLVATVDNFGLHGERPTHPELLDYLALEFQADGRSVKRLIRRLVLTRAYGLASTAGEALLAADPRNQLLGRARARRLEAEPLRDAMLCAAGELQWEPPRGSIVTSFGEQLVQDKLTPEAFHVESPHRSVYLPVVRNGVPDVLQLFDFPDPSLVVGRREETSVPSQDLFLLNSPLVVSRARRFAERLLASPAASDGERIDLGYRLALARGAGPEERQAALAYLEQVMQSLPPSDLEERRARGWAAFCQALFLSSEFRYLD